MAYEKITWRNSPWTAVIGVPLVCLGLLAMLVPWSVSHSYGIVMRRACQTNLVAITTAKAAWAKKENKPNDVIPADSDLFGLENSAFVKPTCPSLGTYTLGSVSEKPRCSIPGHTI